MVRAAYDRIYQDLKREIEDGTYAYEDMLPSQSRLVERYQCAHNTVRKAIGLLASQGYCLPIHGKGVRVIYTPSHMSRGLALDGIATFSEGAERSGISSQTEVKVFERLVSSGGLATLTGFDEGVELLHVERVRKLDGTPLIRDVSYYRADAVRGLTPEQAERSVYAYVENVVGLRLATSKRLISLERVTPTDQALLDLEGCSHLVLVTSSTYDRDASLFEYSESRRHPDHFRLSDTVVRDHKR